MHRRTAILALSFVALVVSAPPALAEFPFRPPGDHSDYKNYRLKSSDSRPSDLSGKLDWMYAANKEANNEPVNSDPRELFGVRGAHVVDRTTPNNDLAWATTTGRPDVTIAVLDSGIKWNDRGAMIDIRKKTRLTKAELPLPLSDRGSSLEAGENCATYQSQYDANRDGVFNVVDYSCDSRVQRDPAQRGGLGVGPSDLLDPQDVLIAFSDGSDDDGNGFRDDIVGWDFLDNDNDPFDDVQYGHGTGESRDSSGEADNGGDLGACPNCMVIHMRVGDSFVADVNRFAQAVLYAVDNDVLVVQEALGTLNNSELARDAVEYAYDHGVTVIASAADEAAQHHNWPSSLPHVIQVNSVTLYDIAITPANRSYLQFNGCTNFMSKTTVAIPSVSCSSDATGRAAGMAGLIHSAALNAVETGKLGSHPSCTRTDGNPCAITANEVRQVMASGSINAIPQADDVNFATQPEPSCTASPAPSCTDPNLNAPWDKPLVSPLATTSRYPTRKGHDSIFGYGRVDMNKAVDALVPANASRMPPEVEISSPEWFAQVDPDQSTVELRGQVYARGAPYRCEVLVAPGSQPNNAKTTDTPPGDFKPVASSWCNGSDRTGAFDGVLAQLDLNDLKSRFPASAGNFDGREPGTGAQTSNGRPNSEPYGFTVKVVATRVHELFTTIAGEDRRNLYLHRDQDMLPGFPKQLTSDGASSPLLVDLDADNRNELVVASTSGEVHAYRPDGSELAGWPVSGDQLALHSGGRAFTSGEVQAPPGGAILASVAAGDLDHDGRVEVIAADLEGRLYVWSGSGQRLWTRESNPDYSGKPLQPFVDVRYNRSAPDESKRRRTQHGFIGSPVLADIDGNDGGRLEIVAGAMDRHLYAWNDDGTQVPGFPVLVVDPTKVASVDAQTHAVSFNSNAGEALNQGAIIVTPAVGDITGDAAPEIIVGTNEEYAANQGNEGPYNASNFNAASVALISQAGGFNFGGQDNPLEGLANAHTRVYAIHSDGEAHAGGPIVSGWPAKLGLLQAELLPIVGEGVTGSPVIGPVTCPSGGAGAKVGAMGNGGPAYILNPNGQSCYGRQDGKDVALQTDFAASGQKYDTPAIPAVGHPAFGNFAGGTSFMTPATGLLRALDVAANEYQGGQDFAAVWDPTSGQFRANFPSPVNDLQFLTGPSIADVDGLPGEELVSGTASLDLTALSAGGAPVNARWPKLTSDWMVANPLIGSWGTLDTEAGTQKRIVALTRSGSILAYGSDASACSPGSWPRFHHDNANSGDFGRDAVLPGKPFNLSLSGGNMSFRAPGDDLLCGTADHYEIVHSDDAITGANFDQAEPLAGAPQPQAAGANQSFSIPSGTERVVAIRAVDEQGNVGPVATFTQRIFPRPNGAAKLRVTLVPGFDPCGSSSTAHGQPLDEASCAPVAQSSDFLTVPNDDTSTANGSLTARVFCDNGETPPCPQTGDQEDVRLIATANDVRRLSDSLPYTGELEARFGLRITDAFNGPGDNEPATVVDTSFSFAIPCSGGGCAVNTTVNTVAPGLVVDDQRAIWALGQIQVYDGGADGLASTTSGNTPFLRQAIFVP